MYHICPQIQAYIVNRIRGRLRYKIEYQVRKQLEELVLDPTMDRIWIAVGFPISDLMQDRVRSITKGIV